MPVSLIYEGDTKKFSVGEMVGGDYDLGDPATTAPTPVNAEFFFFSEGPGCPPGYAQVLVGGTPTYVALADPTFQPNTLTPTGSNTHTGNDHGGGAIQSAGFSHTHTVFGATSSTSTPTFTDGRGGALGARPHSHSVGSVGSGSGGSSHSHNVSYGAAVNHEPARIALNICKKDP